MARLPVGTLAGISEVVLTSGAEYQHLYADSQDDWPGEPERDPMIGRIGRELFPGIWSADILGVYEPWRGAIQLSGYVLENELCEPEFTSLFLKLRTLATFVHEIAHHQDNLLRVSRGRWRADSPQRTEIYAEDLEHDWTRDVLVPYLEEVYAEECQALHAWTREHIGIEVPLEQLAGDPRVTTPSGHTPLLALFPISQAFKALVESLAGGDDRLAMQLEFAREIHYGAHYDTALGIVDAVLAQEPGSIPARILRADLLQHLGRDDEAQAWAQTVLDQDATQDDAAEVLSLVYRERREWLALEQLSETRLANELAEARFDSIIKDHARASLELGDHDALARDVDRMFAMSGRYYRAVGHGYKAISLLRQGLFEQACSAADAGLQPGEAADLTWRHELLAVRFEALHRLGQKVESLEETTFDMLSARGYDAWVEQLRQHPLS